jgi:hypothetical protein
MVRCSESLVNTTEDTYARSGLANDFSGLALVGQLQWCIRSHMPEAQGRERYIDIGCRHTAIASGHDLQVSGCPLSIIRA